MVGVTYWKNCPGSGRPDGHGAEKVVGGLDRICACRPAQKLGKAGTAWHIEQGGQARQAGVEGGQGRKKARHVA